MKISCNYIDKKGRQEMVSEGLWYSILFLIIIVWCDPGWVQTFLVCLQEVPIPYLRNQISYCCIT